MAKEDNASKAEVAVVMGLPAQINEVNENRMQDETALVKIEVPKVPDSVKHAFEQLRDDIITVNERPNYVTLLMAVNTKTARADLIPLPTLDNMTKLKNSLDQFPEAVQNAIKKNIPEADMKASQEIWEYLGIMKQVDQPQEKALPESPEPDGKGKEKSQK